MIPPREGRVDARCKRADGWGESFEALGEPEPSPTPGLRPDPPRVGEG
jgi:hypothetical protein